jgi:hypothetical protein
VALDDEIVLLDAHHVKALAAACAAVHAGAHVEAWLVTHAAAPRRVDVRPWLALVCVGATVEGAVDREEPGTVAAGRRAVTHRLSEGVQATRVGPEGVWLGDGARDGSDACGGLESCSERS